MYIYAILHICYPTACPYSLSRDKLGSEEARALIRHAFGRFYRYFSMVDTHAKPLVTEYTWFDTLMGLQSAVLRYLNRR